MQKFTTSICAVLTFAALLQSTKSIAAPIKTFTEYCQQKSTLPEATKHTVEVLLKKAGTQNCQQANQKLTSLTELDISHSKVSDLQPLAKLTNLTELNLWSNQVTDIKPLVTLTNLSNLNLGYN
ncbi:MAG: leucine-rich repeat domain-containing protein, partial [Cyanobacteria bacterium J06641_2]